VITRTRDEPQQTRSGPLPIERSMADCLLAATGTELVHERDRAQCAPEWHFTLTFAQATALSPGVCKTVGSGFPWPAGTHQGQLAGFVSGGE